ncbi:MAG: hypothetical protein ABFS02_07235 [Pseudomonadota bacterium]
MQTRETGFSKAVATLRVETVAARAAQEWTAISGGRFSSHPLVQTRTIPSSPGQTKAPPALRGDLCHA